MKYDKTIISKARDASFCNYDSLMKLNLCGCYYCLRIFSPSMISEEDAIDDHCGKTAMCPYCMIDSVIGENSGYPLEKEFLEALRDIYFSPPYD